MALTVYGMNILERMKERAQKTKQDLDADRLHKKKESERLAAMVATERAPEYRKDNAYCHVCARDCTTIMRKHGNPTLAYYLGVCPLGHAVRRELTLRDRYYDVSPLVRKERILYADDLLTPNDERFKHVYPDKWRELERAREQRDTTGH